MAKKRVQKGAENCFTVTLIKNLLEYICYTQYPKLFYIRALFDRSSTVPTSQTVWRGYFLNDVE